MNLFFDILIYIAIIVPLISILILLFKKEGTLPYNTLIWLSRVCVVLDFAVAAMYLYYNDWVFAIIWIVCAILMIKNHNNLIDSQRWYIWSQRLKEEYEKRQQEELE